MKHKTLLLGAAVSLLPLMASSQLRLNEIMQSNIYGVVDDLNEFPDSWIELYNPASVAIDLDAYQIGLSSDPADATRLPFRLVTPGAFILVYADKGDGGLHLPFRVDSGKGSLYLFRNGEIVDSLPSIKKMPAPNIAYGRLNETSDKWGYQAQPTPGAANCGTLLKDVLPDPIFSQPGGICTNDVIVRLSLPTSAPSDAKILYILDGTFPTDTTQMYTGPIGITTSTSLRAVLYSHGWLSPMPVTHSYIFHPREQSLPVLSFTANPEYFYSDSLGILCRDPWQDSVPNNQHNWRRPVNIEYFEPGQAAAVNQLCETRVKGHASRTQSWLNSMSMYANKRFGIKRMEHEFFPSLKPGRDQFKSLEIRNSGQDFNRLFFRDAMMQRITGMHTDVDWSAS